VKHQGVAGQPATSALLATVSNALAAPLHPLDDIPAYWGSVLRSFNVLHLCAA
jgi:hypothetical protein